MTSRRAADIVFCIDASASMQPCYDAVQRHIGTFLQAIQPTAQMKWDCRIDFVAHAATEAKSMPAFVQQSLYSDRLWETLYSPGWQRRKYFTRDPKEFCRGLAAIRVNGDEAPLVALDTCVDFPWRDAAACRRVVILLTDEPAETGVYVSQQRHAVPSLIKKIQDSHILLYIVAPPSAIFDQLAQADKSDYRVVRLGRDGLKHVDFASLLGRIGNSVSVSTSQGAAVTTLARGLFGQATWRFNDVILCGE